MSEFYEKLFKSIDKKVVTQLVERELTSQQPLQIKKSFGGDMADRIARFGGSWTFIIIFMVILLFWMVSNLWLLRSPYDPYPFVFLNLVLSTLAAIQAPIILMSQNRQSELDRAQFMRDYEINLKAELEVMKLHEMLAELRATQAREFQDIKNLLTQKK